MSSFDRENGFGWWLEGCLRPSEAIHLSSGGTGIQAFDITGRANLQWAVDMDESQGVPQDLKRQRTVIFPWGDKSADYGVSSRG
jgi:hypothetical protein